MMQPCYADNKGITLYCGDCLEIMPMLPACSFDAIICDPIPFAPMWASLKRVVKPRAAIVLFGSQPFTSALVMSNPKWFRYEWVWEKNAPSGYLDAATRPLKAHEHIIVFADGEPTYIPQKTTGHEPTRSGRGGKESAVYRSGLEDRKYQGVIERYPRTVQYFKKTHESQGLFHPTQKPLALMEYLVRTYTNPGDCVLDFTSGSGTTLRACKNLGRACVGIEKELAYCAATVKRLAPAFEEAMIDDGATLDDLPMFAVEPA